jgi:protein-disulfide isomerase
MSDQQFHACLSNEELQKAVAASRQTAEKNYGVESTPTFFVNGSQLNGELPIEDFDKALAPLLK